MPARLAILEWLGRGAPARQPSVLRESLTHPKISMKRRPASLLLAYSVAFRNMGAYRSSKLVVSLFAAQSGADPMDVGVIVSLCELVPLMLAVYAGRIAHWLGMCGQIVGGTVGVVLGLLAPWMWSGLPARAEDGHEHGGPAFDLLANAALRRVLITSGVILTGIGLFSLSAHSGLRRCSGPTQSFLPAGVFSPAAADMRSALRPRCEACTLARLERAALPAPLTRGNARGRQCGPWLAAGRAPTQRAAA